MTTHHCADDSPPAATLAPPALALPGDPGGGGASPPPWPAGDGFESELPVDDADRPPTARRLEAAGGSPVGARSAAAARDIRAAGAPLVRIASMCDAGGGAGLVRSGARKLRCVVPARATTGPAIEPPRIPADDGGGAGALGPAATGCVSTTGAGGLTAGAGSVGAAALGGATCAEPLPDGAPLPGAGSPVPGVAASPLPPVAGVAGSL